jgi:DMSO/TMAO reductase YedYZ molybdopterin-dependent catalytic subunit
MTDTEITESETGIEATRTKTETESDPERERSTQREKYLSRRRYLAAAGMTAGASILAGCSSSSDDGGSTTETASTKTDTQTGTPEQSGYYTYTTEELKQKYPGLKIFSGSPPNGETQRTDSYTSFKTAVDDSYIRSHYDSPKIEESEHSISLTGMVDEKRDISMEALETDFSSTTVAHTMQCSGNGRGYFDPKVAGNQWTFGAMGTAFYTGAPVIEILDRYGADTSDGNYLSVMGADAPEGEDVFARSIPMSKIKKDCILAYQRNGEPLTAEHGFPVRLIVPGWYGCNSVKWVDRMHVMDAMLQGDKWEQGDQRLYTHWQQYSYRIIPAQDKKVRQNESIDTFDTEAQLESEEIKQPYMYDMMTKSFVTSPMDGATVSPDSDGTIDVLGVAWAGDDEVKTVEVSTDGGKTFTDAEFAGPHPGPTAWRLFRFKWDATPGEHTLVSRATDAKGRVQPATISSPEEGLRKIKDGKYPWNRGGYGCTASMPEAVTVTVSKNK